jgi:hypothetical protein
MKKVESTSPPHQDEQRVGVHGRVVGRTAARLRRLAVAIEVVGARLLRRAEAAVRFWAAMSEVVDVATLQVPALYDNPSHYVAMFRLRQLVESSAASNIVLDLSRCSFIKHNGVAFLGALIRHAAMLGKNVTIDWTTVRSAVHMNLRQNGFAFHFGDEVGPWAGNSIPFRHDQWGGPATAKKRDEIMDYLKVHWLERNWVQVSKPLGNAIRGRVWEIYSNSFEHSGSQLGLFTCGQHYPAAKQLGLCVVDFGIGIPEKVRRFRGVRLKPEDALRWAFESGNSTDPGIGRGLGLDVLRDFVGLNHGRLDVYSGGAHATITHAQRPGQFEPVGPPV